jgi:hypothetical protein
LMRDLAPYIGLWKAARAGEPVAAR